MVAAHFSVPFYGSSGSVAPFLLSSISGYDDIGPALEWSFYVFSPANSHGPLLLINLHFSFQIINPKDIEHIPFLRGMMIVQLCDFYTCILLLVLMNKVLSGI